MSQDIVNVKIPKDILNLFKEVYNLPDKSNKDVMMYAIGTAFPPKAKQYFVKDYNLDEDVFENILESRNHITKSAIEPEFKKINKKLDYMSNSSKDNEKLDVIIQYLKLSLFDSGFSLESEDIDKVVNDAKVKEVENKIKNIVKGDNNE